MAGNSWLADPSFLPEVKQMKVWLEESLRSVLVVYDLEYIFNAPTELGD